MILGIMGTPGAFKTAYVVQEQIVKFLRQGRQIYTNIKGLNPYNIAILFDLDPFDCEHNIHFLGRVYRNDETDSFYEDVEQIRNFHKYIPSGSVVIIDEAQDYFGCREFKSDFSKELIPWLSKCRHENFDVVWITPNFDNVDITFRRTSHLFYKMTRLEHLGFKNSSKISKWSTPDLDLKPVARSVFHPKKIVFDCYASYDIKDVKENREAHNVILRSPFVWFCIACLVWAGWTIFSGNFERTIMHKDVKKKPIVNEQIIEQKEEEVKQNEEVKEDEICISKSSKIRGQMLYYFSDGSSSTDHFGRSFCPGNH